MYRSKSDTKLSKMKSPQKKILNDVSWSNLLKKHVNHFFLIVFLKIAQLLLFILIYTDLFFVKYFTVILENLGKIL